MELFLTVDVSSNVYVLGFITIWNHVVLDNEGVFVLKLWMFYQTEGSWTVLLINHKPHQNKTQTNIVWISSLCSMCVAE